MGEIFLACISVTQIWIKVFTKKQKAIQIYDIMQCFFYI